uniref:Uncharacterized protein n=1 Tax=Cacopsylla melanoneura TaxID=428564 RepID=A0A8D9E8C7_9HEMI
MASPQVQDKECFLSRRIRGDTTARLNRASGNSRRYRNARCKGSRVRVCVLPKHLLGNFGCHRVQSGLIVQHRVVVEKFVTGPETGVVFVLVNPRLLGPSDHTLRLTVRGMVAKDGTSMRERVVKAGKRFQRHWRLGDKAGRV